MWHLAYPGPHIIHVRLQVINVRAQFPLWVSLIAPSLKQRFIFVWLSLPLVVHCLTISIYVANASSWIFTLIPCCFYALKFVFKVSVGGAVAVSWNTVMIRYFVLHVDRSAFVCLCNWSCGLQRWPLKCHTVGYLVSIYIHYIFIRSTFLGANTVQSALTVTNTDHIQYPLHMSYPDVCRSPCRTKVSTSSLWYTH